MKKVTAITIWNDSVGKRMSIVYSEIDETKGTVTSDNNRSDIVVLDTDVIESFDTLLEFAQTNVNSL